MRRRQWTHEGEICVRTRPRVAAAIVKGLVAVVSVVVFILRGNLHGFGSAVCAWENDESAAGYGESIWSQKCAQSAQRPRAHGMRTGALKDGIEL